MLFFRVTNLLVLYMISFSCGLCYSELERQHLILLALLVGSDYTSGIQGVGPVTALEILAAFPAGGTDDNILKGLQGFRDWWNAGMPVGSGKTSLKNKLKDVQFVEGICNYLF
jgi:DNA excision repair protein ERCC-5